MLNRDTRPFAEMSYAQNPLRVVYGCTSVQVKVRSKTTLVIQPDQIGTGEAIKRSRDLTQVFKHSPSHRGVYARIHPELSHTSLLDADIQP